MATVLLLTIPGLVLLLTIVAVVDQLLLYAGKAGLLPWRNSARQGRVAATGFEQLHAAFSPGKHDELKARASTLVLRDDEEDGAPPGLTEIDLAAGTAVMRASRPQRRATPSPAQPDSPRPGSGR